MNVDGATPENGYNSIKVDWSPAKNAPRQEWVIQRDPSRSLSEDAASWARRFEIGVMALVRGNRIHQKTPNGGVDITEEEKVFMESVIGRKIPHFWNDYTAPPLEQQVETWWNEDVHPGQTQQQFMEDMLRMSDWALRHPTAEGFAPSFSVLKEILKDTTRRRLEQDSSYSKGPMRQYADTPREIRGLVPSSMDVFVTQSQEVARARARETESHFGFDEQGRPGGGLLNFIEQENRRLSEQGIRNVYLDYTTTGRTIGLYGHGTVGERSGAEGLLAEIMQRLQKAKTIDLGSIQGEVMGWTFGKIRERAERIGYNLPSLFQDPGDFTRRVECLNIIMATGAYYREIEEHTKEMMDKS